MLRWTQTRPTLESLGFYYCSKGKNVCLGTLVWVYGNPDGELWVYDPTARMGDGYRPLSQYDADYWWAGPFELPKVEES